MGLGGLEFAVALRGLHLHAMQFGLQRLDLLFDGAELRVGFLRGGRGGAERGEREG